MKCISSLKKKAVVVLICILVSGLGGFLLPLEVAKNCAAAGQTVEAEVEIDVKTETEVLATEEENEKNKKNEEAEKENATIEAETEIAEGKSVENKMPENESLENESQENERIENERIENESLENENENENKSGLEQLGQLVEANGSVYVTLIDQVTLTDHIVIEKNTYLTAEKPVTIEMGEYGITVNNASLRVRSPLHFQGEGVNQPLFWLNNAHLNVSGGELWITARGENALALQLNAAAEAHNQLGDLGGGVIHISADQAGSTAVAAEHYSALENLDISALGPGGRGLVLKGEKEAEIYWCRIAAGEASVCSEADFDFSGSQLTPEPEDGREYEWVADWGFVHSWPVYGVWVMAGEEPILRNEMMVSLVKMSEVEDGEPLPSRQTNFSLQWDYDRQVLNEPGEYKIWVTPTLPIPESKITNLEHGRRYQIALHVTEPGRQYLVDASRMEWVPGSVFLNILDPISEGAPFTLWYRVENEAWKSAVALSDAEEYFGPPSENEENFYFYYDPFREQFMVFGAEEKIKMSNEFQLEILEGPQQGKTNVLTVPKVEKGVYATPPPEGSRDGSGLDDQGELEPYQPEPGEFPEEKKYAGSGISGNTGDEEDNFALEQEVPREIPLLPQEDQTRLQAQAQIQVQPQLPIRIEDQVQSPNQEQDPGIQPQSQAQENISTLTTEPDAEKGELALPLSGESRKSRESRESRVQLTASQLNDIRETQPEQMSFIQDGLKVIIPSRYIDTLALSGEDIFTVELSRPKESCFSISFQVGSQEVRGFDDKLFWTYVPFSLEGEDFSNIYCLDEDGEKYVPIRLEKGQLVFELKKTGAYTIVNESEEPAAMVAAAMGPVVPLKENGRPWEFVLSAGCVLLTVGVFWGRRKFLKMRKIHD